MFVSFLKKKKEYIYSPLFCVHKNGPIHTELFVNCLKDFF